MSLVGTYTDPEYKAKHAKSPRGRYGAQKAHANARGVAFTLTFEEWWALWEQSGKWHLRGRGVGQYCMARKGDSGGYDPGNVYIALSRRNLKDQLENGSHVSAKLLPTQYEEIKTRAAAGETQKSISLDIGVNQSTVSRVINGLRGVVHGWSGHDE